MLKKLIATLLLLTFIPFGAVPAAENQINLIKNGGFEYLSKTGIDCLGWTSCEISDTEKHQGQYSVHMKGVGSIAQNIEGLVENEEYTVSAWVKVLDNAVPAFKVFFGDDVNSLGEEMILFDKQAYKDEWTYISAVFKSPKGTTRGGINVRSRWDRGEVYFDDVSFTGKTTLEAIEDYTASEIAEKDTASSAGTSGELILNNSFEIIENEFASGWTNAYKDRCTIEKGNANSGENSVKIDTVGASDLLYRVGISQKFNMVEGYKYDLSFYAKGAVPGMNISIKISTIAKAYPNIPTDKWTKYGFSFTAPESGAFDVLIRLFNTEGVVCIDDISIIGEKYNISSKVKILQPYEGTGELFENCGFESVNEAGNGPKNWAAYGGGTTADWSKATQIKYADEKAHSGKYSVKIENLGETNTNPWVKYIVNDIMPGAEYQISMWINCNSFIQSGIGHKVEWYTEDDMKGGFVSSQSSQTIAGSTGGEWLQFSDTYRAPDGAGSAAVYLRLYTKGEVYFDDVSFYQTGESIALPVSLLTDDVFYYSDYTGNGYADILPIEGNLKGLNVEINESWNVDFRLKDGDKVLASAEKVPFINKTVRFEFPLTLLSELKKEYKVEALVHGTSGKTYELSQVIYKYDRPTALREDGYYILDNGEPFVPVIAYWPRNVKTGTSYIDYCKDIGANVIQTASVTAVDQMKTQLDNIWAKGCLALVCLYPSMTCAGNINNIELTKKMVTALKDHPGVFAYAVLDEPGVNPARLEELVTAYKIIREIDPHHPVYICDAGHYEIVSRYCDMFIIDDYYNMAEYGKNVDIINTASQYRKTNVSLFEAYLPSSSIEEVRFTMYDSLFEGSYGSGYYAILDLQEKAGMEKLRDDLVTLNKSGEFSEAHNHFVLGKYPHFNEYKDDKVSYSLYVKDNELHLAIINKNNADATFEIPLISSDKTVSMGNCTLDILYGGQGSIKSENNVAKVNMTPYQSLVFKITPDMPVNFSGLRQRTKFLDLDLTQWAKEAIEVLESKGIVNSGSSPRAFNPTKNITRADFAMFLMRALNLTGDYTSSFSDIDPSAYYAREIAAGEALGILKGVGDGKYNPEGAITRQDMMTICARGLKYVNKLYEGGADMSGFSDSSLIADYAAGSIASMVKAEIVRGNADGTINPLGNTTRAEAAVIMYRILNK